MKTDMTTKENKQLKTTRERDLSQTKEEEENTLIESIDSKFNFFECFLESKELNKDRTSNSKNKYQNKMQFPIVDTILIDNSQIIAWLFTDKNQYVLKHSKKKITKEGIQNAFLNIIKEYLDNLGKPIGKSNESILDDMSRFISLGDTQMNPEAFLRSANTAYLYHLYSLKFILLTFSEVVIIEKKRFVNIFDFIKYLNDYNKFGTIKMIQNTLMLKQHSHSPDGSIDFNKELLQPLIIQYCCNDTTKCIKLFLLQKRSIDGSDNGSFLILEKLLEDLKDTKNQASLSERSSSQSVTKKINVKELLIPISNESIQMTFEPMVNSFISRIEKKKRMRITKLNLAFLKFNVLITNPDSKGTNTQAIYCFMGAYFLKGVSYDNPLFKANLEKKRVAMEEIIDKRIPRDIIDAKGESIVFLRVTKENVCFGEFCHYEIPRMLKNIKHTNSMENLLEKYTLVNNRFSKRNKAFQLPKKLPVFQIKRAYDNPQLVNMVLKSYSIYPNNNNSAPFRQRGDENELYSPTRNKFEHLNYDSMYNQIGVCYNCFQIYTLINTFIGGMDKFNSDVRTLNKSRSVLYRGVNFNHANYSHHNNDNSKKFDEEIKQIVKQQQVYSKIVFDERLKCLQEIRKDESGRIYQNRGKALEENNRRFQYHIDINPKVLQWKTDKDQVSSGRMPKREMTHAAPLKQSLQRCASSISTFRLNLGLNACIGYMDDNQIAREDKEKLSLSNFHTRTIEKSQGEKENDRKELDIDIFLLYKNLRWKNDDENIVSRFIKTKKETVLKPNLINTQKAVLKSHKDIMPDIPMMALEEDNIDQIEEESSQIEKPPFQKDSKKNNKVSFDDLINSFRVTPVDTLPRRVNSLKEEQIDREYLIDYSSLQKSTEEKREEEKEKLKKFVHLPPKYDEQKSDGIETVKEMKKKKDKSKSKKKIQVSSIFYRKNYEHADVPYYFISTPIAKFNEANFIVDSNAYLSTQKKIISKEYQEITGFNHGLLSDSLIFVYDNHTAVPYKVISIKSKNKRSKKGKNLIIFVINDFFESYSTYSREMASFFSQYQTNEIFYRIRLVFFNLPGQLATLWSSHSTLNNLYYCNFFDHFLFFLYKQAAFDKTYRGVILGFGNGGQIGMTYLSNYDKFGDFFDSFIVVNAYVKNDSFLSQSMLEILNMASKEKNKKLIDFFVKSITLSPSILAEIKNDKAFYENTLDSNSISMNGYYEISKGYFYNVEVDLMKITVPSVFIHSTQNSFISIQNTSSTISNKKDVISGVTSKDDPNVTVYDFTPLWKGNKKVFVPINCSHDLNHSIDVMILLDILSSYMKHYIDNIK